MHRANLSRFDTLTCLTVLALGLLATKASAFRMIEELSTGRVTSGAAVPCNNPGGFAHWTTATIPWRHNLAGQGSDKAGALQAAMASWTNVSGANHTLTYAGTTTAGFTTDNINTIVWSSGNGCTGNCAALTALVLQPGQVIVEADITFNSSRVWNTNGTDVDTEAVAAHELGHALGIHHTEVVTSPQPTMSTTYFGSSGRTLEADDRSALQCSQNRYPVGGGGTTTVRFSSIGSEDGHITESNENSNVGGNTISNQAGGGGLKIGDAAVDQQRRSIVSFGTAPIPDGATIVSAALELRRGTVVGSNPFDTHGPCRVDIKSGTFGSAALVASDFQAAATVVGAATLTRPASNGSLSIGTLNAAGRNAINKQGRTQLRIYCNRGDNDNSSTDLVGFYPGENASSANRPKLVVTYQ